MMKTNRTVDGVLSENISLKEENKKLLMDLAELKRIVEDKISLLATSEAMRKEEKEKSQRDTFIRIDLESEIAVLKKNSERREKKLAELSDENAELKYVIIDNERDIKSLESRVTQLSKSREDQKVSENVVVVENQVNKTISRMKLKNDDIDDICNIICNSTVEKYGERAWFHLNNYGYSKIEEKLEQLTQVVFYNKESCIKFRDITREYIVNNGGQMEWNGYVRYMKDHDNKAERENKLRMSLKEAKGKISIYGENLGSYCSLFLENRMVWENYTDHQRIAELKVDLPNFITTQFVDKYNKTITKGNTKSIEEWVKVLRDIGEVTYKNYLDKKEREQKVTPRVKEFNSVKVQNAVEKSDKPTDEEKVRKPFVKGRLTCFYCKKEGHVRNSCPDLAK
ncbi:hypothetical protein DICPUDRAFT_79264 [Dictyostelium purpureum]|uniref:CCHC-type domain-containing protein n=1 Tax=Dictyostelium purpureum TaxID=5786 RepID=F0ZM22_DICPU|nr:uncharacterized protein DICPUDRAFT_79264 [Dictyostelium purpureum]EGC34992.1 hypothetical protein DICPUDRAFT_79264 [Dictyostelium purpureum]|eukprot:XP_003288466.1 hypothetical protein DICPUDRAFT_79264 [Dictyostelium purpureum]